VESGRPGGLGLAGTGRRCLPPISFAPAAATWHGLGLCRTYSRADPLPGRRFHVQEFRPNHEVGTTAPRRGTCLIRRLELQAVAVQVM